MKPILDIVRTDWKTRFLFVSLVVCVGLIIVMMVALAKIL